VFINGNCITESSHGLFARAMTSRYTQLPVIEETELETRVRYQRFVDEVLEYRKTRPTGHNIDDYQCFLI
jgi:hypothetical protein